MPFQTWNVKQIVPTQHCSFSLGPANRGLTQAFSGVLWVVTCVRWSWTKGTKRSCRWAQTNHLSRLLPLSFEVFYQRYITLLLQISDFTLSLPFFQIHSPLSLPPPTRFPPLINSLPPFISPQPPVEPLHSLHLFFHPLVYSPLTLSAPSQAFSLIPPTVFFFSPPFHREDLGKVFNRLQQMGYGAAVRLHRCLTDFFPAWNFVFVTDFPQLCWWSASKHVPLHLRYTVGFRKGNAAAILAIIV